LSKDELCELFHPDNIKNKDSTHSNIGVSLARFYHTHGGIENIARSLKTNLKVCTELILPAHRPASRVTLLIYSSAGRSSA